MAHLPRFSYAARYTLSHDKQHQDELLHLVSTGKLHLNVEEAFPFTQEGIFNITTCSTRALAYVNQFGADRVLDCSKVQWWNQVLVSSVYDG